MRRWIAVPVLVVVAVVLTACGNGLDDAAEDREAVVVSDLDRAVEVAQLSLPSDVSDPVVARLVKDLCAAAGTGDVTPVVQQLQASAVLGDTASALDALAAGAGTYCPDDVDEVVPTVEQALAPAPASAPGAAGGTGGTTAATPGSSGGGGSGTTGTSGSSGSSNSSSGAAVVGGGSANGAGNQSSTDYTQSVGSGSSTNSNTTP